MRAELSPLQQDALKETLNIGCGRASRMVSQLTGNAPVAMGVPVVVLKEPGDVASIVSDFVFESDDVFSVQRSISGVDGHAVIIFHASAAMVQALAERSSALDDGEGGDPREAVANKLAYVILEACIDQIEHVVGRTVEREPLHFHLGVPSAVFGTTFEAEEDVIIVKIDLGIAKYGVVGHVLFALPHKAANRMAEGLDRVLEETER